MDIRVILAGLGLCLISTVASAQQGQSPETVQGMLAAQIRLHVPLALGSYESRLELMLL